MIVVKCARSPAKGYHDSRPRGPPDTDGDQTREPTGAINPI